MATVINTERSKFINDVIRANYENKVGQFSKYLDVDPTFVTYYSINMANSRADIGTDAIDSVLGKDSPIKYNKIENFPIYFKSDLEPQLTSEDGMISHDIELSDITILPNTVIPKPFDHFVIRLPKCQPILFRVNSFRNMTIQSNSFFSTEAHAIVFGDSCEDEIKYQVIEKYKCIFENIGTQNSCFIRSDDYDIAQHLLEVVNKFGQLYTDLYYFDDAGSFIYNESLYYSQVTSHIFEQYKSSPYDYREYAGINPQSRWSFFRPAPTVNEPIFSTFYDVYLTRFIMESSLFFSGNDNRGASAVVYEDNPPVNFDYSFRKTLWYAILTKDSTFLARYPYYINDKIKKVFSILASHRYEDPRGFSLYLNIKEHAVNNGMGEYFSHDLIKDIIDGKETTDPTECDYNDNQSFINLEKVIDTPDKDFGNGDGIGLKDYDVKMNTDTPEETWEEKKLKFTNNLIYSYMYGLPYDAAEDELFIFFSEPCLYDYEHMPIVLFILKERYAQYFVSEL